MTLDEQQLIQTLMQHRAEIHSSGFGNIHAAYPAGNRRRKPVCWIEKDTLTRMLCNGWLERRDNWVRVSAALKGKLAGENKTQADHLCGREAYIPDAMPPARAPRRVPVLLRIARQTLPGGQPALSAAQVEAGQHFAKDYALGGLGFVATQNYEAASVEGGDRHGKAEDAIIMRMDRRKRVSEAISCLGPGLDRALIAVCCEDWPLEQLERTEKWAKYTGRTILALALDRLVDFYGTRPGEAGSRKRTT